MPPRPDLGASPTARARKITPAELQKHSVEGDAWLAVDGKVRRARRAGKVTTTIGPSDRL